MPDVCRKEIAKSLWRNGHLVVLVSILLGGEPRVRPFVGELFALKSYRERFDILTRLLHAEAEQSRRIYAAAQKDSNRHVTDHVASNCLAQEFDQLGCCLFEVSVPDFTRKGEIPILPNLNLAVFEDEVVSRLQLVDAADQSLRSWCIEECQKFVDDLRIDLAFQGRIGKERLHLGRKH